jgi:hypothetical protein
MSTYKRVINPIVVIAILAIQLATPTIALADDPPASDATPTEVVVTETPVPPDRAEATPAVTEIVEVTPAETATATEETVVPAETAAVTEEVVTPAETAAATEEVATPAETAAATEEVATPAETAAATEEVATPAETAAATEEVATPAETAAATEEVATPAETAAATEEVATPAETAAATEEVATPAETAAAAEETAVPVEVELTPIVTEILDQAPAGTEVVALTSEGEVAPLDTLEAVEIIASSDPVWCPEGSALGDAACTPNQDSVANLITVLANPANGYSGNGTLYFQEGAYDNIFTGETIITLNSTALPGLGGLTLWGGWDIGGTNTNTGTTDFSIPIVVDWNGNITLRDIVVDFGAGGSTDTGIYVDTPGNIVLDNVEANNGSDGADLINYTGTGNVNVTDSSFSDNTNTGLNVVSSGAITVDNTDAADNNTGIAIDNTSGTSGTDGINLTDIDATNNAWTGVDARSSGPINLENVTVTGSQVGAYLDATHGPGAINVETSTFNSNDEIGLKAITGSGNIQLTEVNTDSTHSVESLGAWIKSYSGGRITVTDSIFDNAQTGLFVVGTNNVLLDNVSAGNNSGNGAMIQSGWVFACIPPNGIRVTVDGGNYHNNGEYGFVAYPGPKGKLTLSGTITYLANAHGNYLKDLKKTCVPPKKTPPSKPYKVVKVPKTGGKPETVDCKKYKGTVLVLPDQSQAKIVCPAKGDFLLEKIAQDKLPGELPTGPIYVDSLTISLKDSSKPVTVLKDGGSFLISFKIPKDFKDKRFAIMYWDVTSKDGAGAWVELPREQFAGQEFPLHPKTPEDGMQILRGVYNYDDSVSVKVNFTGTFVLIAR